MAYIKLNRENFYYNLKQIAKKTGSKEKIAIVLKDNAYGHGLEQIAYMARDFGIRHAVVADVDEAEVILALFETVLILGGEVRPLARCSYAINDLSQIAQIPKNTRVELKVDTGMHRNGIAMRELNTALSLIEAYQLDLVGLMTHYRSADSFSSEFFWQEKQFETIKREVKERVEKDIRIHSYNSAAILRKNEFCEDLVRVGIAAYGYNELDRRFDAIPLRPVLSLCAKRLSSRLLHPAQRVGYGGSFQADRAMHVSTYDIGYGDGWCRGNAHDPYITADGFPILGRVSMDFMTLESLQDEVCIMSDAQKAAKHYHTISYEMTTALSPTIERVIDVT